MEEKNIKQDRLKAVVLLLIGFIIGFAAHAFTVTKEGGALDTTKEGLATEEVLENSTTTPVVVETNKASAKTWATGDAVVATLNTASSGGYSLTVNDQSAGNSVVVAQTDFEQASWVAVREDINGKMGNILGAYLLQEGPQSGVVELLRPTEAGLTYYVAVYMDDGDQEFDFKKDALLINESGEAVASAFKTN